MTNISQLSIIPPAEQSDNKSIAIFKPFETQLSEIKEHNFKLVFDYSDKDGNEAARSHIWKLRQTKAAIEKKRKEEKDESLNYGRAIDSEANRLKDEIDLMIDVHKKPLDEWEEKETKRRDSIVQRITAMTVNADRVMNKTAAELKEMRAALEAIAVNDDFGEFQNEAMAARLVGMDYLAGVITIAETREREAEELRLLREAEGARQRQAEAEAESKRKEQEEKAERDRLEQADRDRKAREEREEKERKDREGRAAQEAAEKARREEQEASAKREKELKDEIERTAREGREKLEKQQRENDERERKRKDDEQRDRERQEGAIARSRADDALREADKEHRRGVHAAIVKAMLTVNVNPDHAPITEDQAKAIVIAICGDVIPHIKIIY